MSAGFFVGQSMSPHLNGEALTHPLQRRGLLIFLHFLAFSKNTLLWRGQGEASGSLFYKDKFFLICQPSLKTES